MLSWSNSITLDLQFKSGQICRTLFAGLGLVFLSWGLVPLESRFLSTTPDLLDLALVYVRLLESAIGFVHSELELGGKLFSKVFERLNAIAGSYIAPVTLGLFSIALIFPLSYLHFYDKFYTFHGQFPILQKLFEENEFVQFQTYPLNISIILILSELSTLGHRLKERTSEYA
uniref:Uncharacterized protein n=1 Tax=Glossina brevipalpis TaxID=37001 RepID=A0A1A9X4E9_9MUSC